MLTRNLLGNTFDLAREMDRLFESVVSGTHARIAFPPVNVWEDDQTLYVEAEAPGLTLDQVEVSVTGDTLSIKGQRQVRLPQDATPLRRERGVGQFERTVTLACEIEAEKVDAKLKDGVLTITLPKAAAVQPRRISVKTG